MDRETAEVVSDWTVDTLRSDLLARMKAERRALNLQAREYERRLDELNNAHARAEALANRTVSNDKFEEYKTTQETALDLALERQDTRIGSLETWKAKAVGAGVIFTFFAGLIGAAIFKAFGG